jgi:hypothetical protein
MEYVKYVIMMICLTSLLFSAKAQQPVTITVFSESTSVPFTTLLESPVHPGIQVGTEFNWREGQYLRLYPAVNIGYMFHRKLFHGLYGNVELGLDFKTGFGLNFKTKLGLGYLRTFSTQQEFQFEDGQYISKNDRGNSRLMPSFTVGLGYELRHKDPYSPEIFIGYQTWLEYPYSPGFIPLMSHTNLMLGTRFYPVKK